MWKVAEPHYEPNPVLAHALDVLFILHADHEQNCGTAAMRVIGSSHPDPYSCCAGAAAAVYGPRHGGANEAVIKMLNEIGSVDNVDAFVKGVKEGKGRLQGFGHRVYKNFDPRATIIKKIAYDVFEVTGKNPLLDIAVEARGDRPLRRLLHQPQAVPQRRLLLGPHYQAMDFPIDTFTVLFAIPRCVRAGWRTGRNCSSRTRRSPCRGSSTSGPKNAPTCPWSPRSNLAYRPTLAASNESRVSARLIDVVIELTIAGIILALAPTGRPLASDFLVVVAITAYETIFLTTLGATPGKLALGLRVATLDREGPVRPVAAFRRGFVVALCFAVLSVGTRPRHHHRHVPHGVDRAVRARPPRLPRPHGGHGRGRPRRAPPLITSDDVEQWYSARRAAGVHRAGASRWASRTAAAPARAPRPVTAAGPQRRRGGHRGDRLAAQRVALVWMCLLWLVVFTIDETLQVARTGTTAGHREAGYEIVDITTGGHPSMGRSTRAGAGARAPAQRAAAADSSWRSGSTPRPPTAAPRPRGPHPGGRPPRGAARGPRQRPRRGSPPQWAGAIRTRVAARGPHPGWGALPPAGAHRHPVGHHHPHPAGAHRLHQPRHQACGYRGRTGSA